MGKLSIAFVVSEADELHRFGGLADFGGSLPRTLKRLGHDVRVFMPSYPDVVGKPGFQVEVGGKKLDVWETQLTGNVPVYVIARSGDFDNYHLGMSTYQNGQRDERLNRGFIGTVYQRDLRSGDVVNASLFSQGAIATAAHLQERGFKPDVFHSNEWASALVPLLLRSKASFAQPFEQAASVHTFHNNDFRGRFQFDTGVDVLERLLLKGAGDALLEGIVVKGYSSRIELAQAADAADKRNTVTPAYASVMQKDGAYPDLVGIVNGFDSINFSPARALGISSVSEENISEVVKAKQRKKLEVQRRFGLTEDPLAFMVCYLHRYSEQKGTDLANIALPFMLQYPRLQFVARGGDATRAGGVAWLVPSHAKARVSALDTFATRDEEEMIYAASDLLLMPSRREPCGYSQMKAMGVGTVPLVNPVEGLLATVKKFNFVDCFEGNGLYIEHPLPSSKWEIPYNSLAFGLIANLAEHVSPIVSSVLSAADLYSSQPVVWRKLMGNCVSTDFRWNQGRGKGPVTEYVSLYREAIDARRGGLADAGRSLR
jgi:starch synthase